VPYDPLFEKNFSNICKVTKRNGWVALVTDAESIAKAEEVAFGMLVFPRTHSFVLACRAITKGKDIDQPRNLAKSVTLECDRRYGRLCPHRKKKKNRKKKKTCGTVRALARIGKGIRYYE
jgi:hypothetical protein